MSSEANSTTSDKSNHGGGMNNTEKHLHQQAVDDLRERFLSMRRRPFSKSEWQEYLHDLRGNVTYRYWLDNQASILGYHGEDKPAFEVDVALLRADRLFVHDTSEAARLMRQNVAHALTGMHDASRDPNYDPVREKEEGITFAKDSPRHVDTDYSLSVEAAVRNLDERVRRLEGEV